MTASIPSQTTKFPKGIEVTCGLIIRNNEGRVLIARSPNWSDVWILPGGHIEPGETIAQAAVREGKEETGLDLKVDHVLGWGELIGSPSFGRHAHFIFFAIVLDIIGGELILDPNELLDAQWLLPKQLKSFNLGQIYSPAISQLIENYLKDNQ